MCFSARASFVAAALLLPLGGLAVRHVWREGETDRLPLAVTPVLFALQQIFEGLVWLRVGPAPEAFVHPDATVMALAYLFFAYGLWPAWIPFVALRWSCASQSVPERRWLTACVFVGFIFGLLLWLPLLHDPPSALPSLVHGSLRYPITPLVPGLSGQMIGQALYVMLIAGPLVLPTASCAFSVSRCWWPSPPRSWPSPSPSPRCGATSVPCCRC
jgi:hypothetical protein